ncbi:hypothetical protein tb265_43430 [Gemmatimonadetes bacterium T265]|nr:hypothetical protein tb265_43430 [Gemmatimonadetes bacterium T265]
MTDAEIIRAFPRYEGSGEPGFFIDFLGTRTRTAYISTLPQAGGVVEDYPAGDGNFHASTVEWAGALRAVLDACRGVPFVVVELGAGWGPWLVSLASAARAKGLDDVRLVGIEGSADHVAYMHTHFADNGIDPRRHRLVHAVVGTSDGVAEFPVHNEPSVRWGDAAIFTEPQPWTFRRVARPVYHGLRRLLGRAPAAAPPRAATVRVPSLSIPTVLRDFARVDLVHIDIQGHEYDVVASARGVLRQKVHRLVIGTHGRDIEAQLRDELGANGWTLEADEQCVYTDEANQLGLYRDGCQVWRNPAIA